MFLKIRYFSTITVITLINILFIYKYSTRLNNHLITTSAIIIGCIFPVLLLKLYFNFQKNKFLLLQPIFNSLFLRWTLISGIVLGSIVFFQIYPQNLLKVDRYEMIQLFWDNIFSHKCPYCPRSEGTNIPGPFPFYFYLAFPFYLLKEIGYLSLLAVCIFFLIVNSRSISNSLKNSIVLLLVTSPIVIYEVLGRSTNFLNMLLILLFFLLIKRITLNTWKVIILVGITMGLLLSTRSVSFLLILLAFVFKFRSSFFSFKTIMTGVIALFSFATTFTPVIAICRNQFLQYNPFTVQASLAPPIMFIVIAIGAVAAVVLTKDIYTWCWIAGMVCFLLFAGYFLQNGYGNFNQAVLQNIIDISYSAFSVPFLLLSLTCIESKNAKLIS